MRRLWLVAVVLALGCGGSGDRVVVGSKNFTEQRILGELLAQTLEANGLAVERRLDLGGTFVCDAALRNGQIDTYVEYTGTALTAVLKEQPATDPADVLARVRKGYAPAGLVWTAPLGFDNTFALVTRGDAGPTTISSAVAPARAWRAGFGYEFQQRPDGYPMLQRVYGLQFAQVRTLDLGLLYRALIDKQVDLVVGSATDGLIETQHLTMLADDRHAFPPYEAVPIVRQATLDRWPVVKTALESLGGTLTAATMRTLNHRVDGEHRSPADVVRAWREAHK
jgi:osmoprotectant transport system substrate-binding protein